MPDIAEHVRQAFASAGYGTGVVEATSRYARLVLQFPGSGDELEMDLLKEALGPGAITVQLAPGASVRALSLDDAAGLKARAWHDRFVIRDIIDLHAAAGAFSYVDMENLARRHEPDLDLGTILEHLAGVSVFADEDFAEYGLNALTLGWPGGIDLAPNRSTNRPRRTLSSQHRMPAAKPIAERNRRLSVQIPANRRVLILRLSSRLARTDRLIPSDPAGVSGCPPARISGACGIAAGRPPY